MPIEDLVIGATARRKISVIIPVWREHAMAQVLVVLGSAGAAVETIVSCADPEPATLRLVTEMGAKCIDAGKPNRGRQLDLGAAEATDDWLLFQH